MKLAWSAFLFSIVLPRTTTPGLINENPLPDGNLSNLTKDEQKNEYNDAIELPKTNEYNALFTSWVALQLLAYYIADELWKEIDKPRNLAKSVTVE